MPPLISHHGRGVLRGQLTTGLELARHALVLARRGLSLLSHEDQAALAEIDERLAGIEQRAWIQDPVPRKR